MSSSSLPSVSPQRVSWILTTVSMSISPPESVTLGGGSPIGILSTLPRPNSAHTSDFSHHRDAENAENTKIFVHHKGTKTKKKNFVHNSAPSSDFFLAKALRAQSTDTGLVTATATVFHCHCQLLVLLLFKFSRKGPKRTKIRNELRIKGLRIMQSLCHLNLSA